MATLAPPRDLVRQDSTQPRTRQDFTNTVSPPTVSPTAKTTHQQLVLVPRTERNLQAPDTGGRRAVSLAGSLFSGCNTALVPQSIHPQPPGAFITRPSFVVPGRPDLDDRNLPPLFPQKRFFRREGEGRSGLPQSFRGEEGARDGF